MSVHYKFKSALDFDTVSFDGLHISVTDLKKAIVHQKRLGKTSDFDLQITNAQTKEEYSEDSTLIPKNTSLIIARIPLATLPKKPWDPQADKIQNQRAAPEQDSGTLDLSQMNGTEEDKINAMMVQSTMDYDPNNYQKVRGQGQTGEVPANYRCFKCHKPGHWIKNCPLGSSGESMDIKRNTGIPRSFIERDSQEKAAACNKPPELTAAHVVENKQEIPEDLICGICKDLFTDAVMIPCCGSSFCDECVRTALLESEDNECPDCKEKGSSPGSLIPNRFLRNSVNAFRNETGYNKPRQQREPPKCKSPPPVEIANSNGKPLEKKLSSPNIENEFKENKEKHVDEYMVDKLSEKPTSQKLKEKNIISQKPKEKNTIEVIEKKTNEIATHSSHDENESDFEDNITVTVPPAHLQSQRSAFREKHYNGRHSRNLKPPGIESSPKNSSNLQVVQTSFPNTDFNKKTMHRKQLTPSTYDDRSETPTIDENEPVNHGSDQQSQHPVPSHHPVQRESNLRSHGPSDIMYNTGPPGGVYAPPQALMSSGRPYDGRGGYGMPHPPGYIPPYMLGDRIRGPFPGPRPGYPIHQMRPRHMVPAGGLESVYRGVAAKVGTGIIDDPLEAFNRIMREKEKRKEERRRSPINIRRRSRSIEMTMNRTRGHSPPIHHGRPTQRLRTPDDRRNRSSPLLRERGRGRSRDKRSLEKDRRRQRSSSFSDRSSRSRSWSHPRKRTRSPLLRRRSRSRSPSFSRYRQKENRRPEKRDEFQREDFHERSPVGNYQQRRGRSRDRMQPSPQFFRQNRHQPGGYGPDSYHINQMAQMASYNDAPYSQNNRFPPRNNQQPQFHRGENYNRIRDNEMDRYDDTQAPGSDEPPPPGFEGTPQRDRRNSWDHFDVRPYRDDLRHPDNARKEYMNRPHTPEINEKQVTEHDDRWRNDTRDRDVRSWSTMSAHSPNNSTGLCFDKRRGSRSKTPLRNERVVEQQQYVGSRDHHNTNKDRNGSRDHQTHCGNDRDKTEHDRRRERDDRERHNVEHIRDKKEQDRRLYEKETRRTGKEEKEREKEKDKEKDKRKESSDEEKKDKKSKEKRKKKKEKDQDKKKIKKERKEKDKEGKTKKKEKEKEARRELAAAKEKEKEEEEENRNNLSTATPENSYKDVNTVNNNNSENIKNIVERDIPLLLPPREEGEIIEEDDNSADQRYNQNDDSTAIDLYGDICEDEIRYDYTNALFSGQETKVSTQEKEDINISSPNINRFDSVLDIHANLDFEPDLEDLETTEIKKETDVFVPEPSKWERDDETQVPKDEKKQSFDILSSGDDKALKVTTEVIKRAENAIFARAINAIRPIEIKKISIERQKLYSNEISNDSSPISSLHIIKSQSPSKDMPTFQITVPTNSNTSERSVEMKADKHKRSSPLRSVKDRLGIKITDPITNQRRHRSRTITPPRKLLSAEGNRVEKARAGRSKSKEPHYLREDTREGDGKRGSEIRKIHDGRTNRDRNQKDVTIDADVSRQRERSKELRRSREMDRRRDFGNVQDQRSRDSRMWDQNRGRWERDRGVGGDKDRRNSHERNREKVRERLREGDRIRDNREGYINRESSLHSRDNKQKEKHISKERGKSNLHSSKKDRSHSQSSEKSPEVDKRAKCEKNNKRKRPEIENIQESEKKMKADKSSRQDGSDNKVSQRKKACADGSSCALGYDEKIHDDLEQQVKFIGEENDKKIERVKETIKDKVSKDKVKTPDSIKRSRSPSASTSTSSSTDSESDTNSDGNPKKKKKKKHKKEKKRLRRSSSIDTTASTKHKRSKNKKKSKNSKKKKKNKK